MADRGVSNAELAEGIGVSHQTVSAWRRDKSDPELRKLRAIASALRVHASDLLMSPEVRCPSVPPDDTIFFGRLTPELREWLLISGRRIEMARKALFPDLDELVTACRCHSVSVWLQYETGTHFPDPMVLSCFCDKTGVTLNFLFRGILAGLPESPLRTLVHLYPELMGDQDVPPYWRESR